LRYFNQDLHQEEDQIDMIDSTLPEYIQNLALNQIRLVLLKHNSPRTMEHYKASLRVDGTFEHKARPYTFLRSK